MPSRTVVNFRFTESLRQHPCLITKLLVVWKSFAKCVLYTGSVPITIRVVINTLFQDGHGYLPDANTNMSSATQSPPIPVFISYFSIFCPSQLTWWSQFIKLALCGNSGAQDKDTITKGDVIFFSALRQPRMVQKKVLRLHIMIRIINAIGSKFN